jgi:hypothetical protein
MPMRTVSDLNLTSVSSTGWSAIDSVRNLPGLSIRARSSFVIISHSESMSGFGNPKDKDPLDLGGWFVSDDHTSVQNGFRRADELQLFGEPYLLYIHICCNKEAVGRVASSYKREQER